MQITRSSTEGATGKGPAEWFTGEVYIAMRSHRTHLVVVFAELARDLRLPPCPAHRYTTETWRPGTPSARVATLASTPTS
jgi:hypothetical protein